MSKKRISRRTMLKGLGTVAIALPFLEEMVISSATANPTQAPMRAFNVFFGLGIPAPLQEEGFNGVLEPLEPLKDKLLIMRNVDQVRVDESGSNAHYDGSAGAFTAEAPDGTARAGGPSIDQVIRNHYYPDGQPAGVIPNLVAGTFFRRDRTSRHTHSWKADGTASASMQESPQMLFERIFGSMPLPEEQETARKMRLQQSVLDSVVDQYRHYSSEASPLGADSKQRLSDHLERVREYEQRIFGEEEDQCPRPSPPPDSVIPHGGVADPSGEGIDITIDELVDEWRLQAGLYALAIKCDQARFGSLTYLAAGERIRLTGRYEYDGRHIFDFDDSAQLGQSGSGGCSHEWWHKFNPSNQNEQLRAHVHLKMREVAYFLKLLDVADAVEQNGKTILENSLITVSTESGDGRHSDVQRELSGIFHAVTGANGRLKTGQVMDVGAEGLDVYNTILTSLQVNQRLGPSSRQENPVDSIRL